jgi:hypothetical protein
MKKPLTDDQIDEIWQELPDPEGFTITDKRIQERIEAPVRDIDPAADEEYAEGCYGDIDAYILRIRELEFRAGFRACEAMAKAEPGE